MTQRVRMKSEVIRECVTLSARSGKASWRWSLMGYNLRDRWEKLGRRESRRKKTASEYPELSDGLGHVRKERKQGIQAGERQGRAREGPPGPLPVFLSLGLPGGVPTLHFCT